MGQNNRELVTVVMPLFNKESFVERSLLSVINQTHSNFEFVIINDGSTDSSIKVVKQFPDSRIRLIEQDNAGVSAARNKGIEAAKGDLIAFIDADDEWDCKFLATLLSLVSEFPQAAIFATGYRYLECNGEYRMPRINGLPSKTWRGILPDYFAVAAESDPPIWSSAVLVKKDALMKIGLFPVGITSGEDLLTWARLALEYPVAYDATALSLFRQRAHTQGVPTRIPDMRDPVGAELKKLLNRADESQVIGLRHYIAWWHKGRASMYLRLSMRGLALKEILKMGRYRPNWKFLAYLASLPIPLSVRRSLLQYRAIRE